jgi:hypothetical protein|tara:strand:+ start:177 stop:362 length:186 start_codon:yes stop_codon:yes gene_type:complete
MAAVKQALLEVEEFVQGCLKDGRTLNQTIRDARESTLAKSNPYLDDTELVENKYYQFKGAQ